MLLPAFISKIPMKISLPLLFTVPVFAVVIFLSIITFSEGKIAANDLMAQNLVQIHDHIEERLDDLLNLPNHIQRINRELARFLGGKSPGDDLTFVIVKVKE